MEILYKFLHSDFKIGNFCKTFKVNKNRLEQLLKDNGYYLNTPYITGNNIRLYQLAIIDYLESNSSTTKSANKYNVNNQQLIKYLKNLNLYEESRKGIKQKNYNEHFFDSIDTEEKAYWLGFIFADGYIYGAPLDATKTRIDWNFELCTKGEDKSHMEKFAKAINYNKELKITKSDKQGHTRCRVCLSSKILWKQLYSLGCTPRKSLTLKFPDENIFKSKDLIRHFIRGYFDGDGCITYLDKEHTIPSYQILGTKEFLESILKYLKIDEVLFHNHNNNGESTMFFHGTGRKAMDLFHKLYDNCSIYLNRKYERFIYFCRILEKSDMLKQTNIGEGCEANTEITIETKESIASQSVEIEPEKSE